MLIAQPSGEPEQRRSELERLHGNVWRALRLLFSTERHRSLIKKLIPFNMFEAFCDIGNFKKDLKLYFSLVEMFYKLTVSTRLNKAKGSLEVLIF